MKWPRARFTVRRMMLAVLIAALVMWYVGSYYRLSRRGMREAVDYGLDGFLYVPCALAAEPENQLRDFALATWYAPLNWLDRKLFGAPRPATGGIMCHLSG